MGFRVEKSNKSFLPQLKDHRRKLAARQHSEREEATRKRILEQAAERNKRAASRAPALTHHTAQSVQHNQLMNDIDGEEILNQNSSDSISSISPSSRRELKPLSSIKFKRMAAGPSSNTRSNPPRPQFCNPIPHQTPISMRSSKESSS